MSQADNIKVAVRVRPFSEREKQRGAVAIVVMKRNSTFLSNPEKTDEKPREFTFDYSFWSHDGYQADDTGYFRPTKNEYIDQTQLFQSLGQPMLDNTWGGYNCTIFAYGQTGSGKSYSIMGHGANKGLVPSLCTNLFQEVDKRRKSNSLHIEVTFSMLEIYNEQVRDLLNKRKSPKGGLIVKEHPTRGFYVENVTIIPVGSYQDISLRLNEGDKQRTLAATKMNEASSRAHTIVCITVTQTDKTAKKSKYASMNMVDLAGSERQKQTESSGDRFEEAKNINKSLLTLGNVIKALCDKATSKSSSTHIPYRESVLTRLLKNALGGNSKTFMLAAISPDAENFEQTLSTLRYADRAKSIRTMAQVNQDDTDKIIKELIMEKEKLLKDLENARSMKGVGYSDEDLQRMKAEQEDQIQRYRDQMKDMESAWAKRLEQARLDMEEELKKQKQDEEQEKKVPHLHNLNEDPGLTGKILHLLKKNGKYTVGSGKDGAEPNIVMNGLRIHKDHCVLTVSNVKVTLESMFGQTLHNGRELKNGEIVDLHHQDRIRFGSNNLYVFRHPDEEAEMIRKKKALRTIDYEFAQEEIAQHAGYMISEEDSVLQREVMQIMQLMQDVNSMAEDLNKDVQFSILLVSPDARGDTSGKTEIFVKLTDLQNGNEYLWKKDKFLNRQVLMQEMYNEYVESGNIPLVEKASDPFWEPADTTVVVGVVTVPLKYLSHMLEFDEEPITVIDYKAKNCGFLKVDLIPCDKTGKEGGDLTVHDPIDLVGKRMCFKVKIIQAHGLPSNFKKTWCRYKFYLDQQFSTTDIGMGSNPKYNHERLFVLGPKEVDHKLIDYLSQKSLTVEILGQQEETIDPAAKNLQDKREKVLDLTQKNKKMEECLKKIKHIAVENKKDAKMKEIEKLIDELGLP